MDQSDNPESLEIGNLEESENIEADEEADAIENLIECVRRRKILYDSTSKDFKNTAKKELEWIRVATDMKMEVLWCKAKWKYLRDNYVKKRNQLKGKSGDAAKKVKKWPYFEILKFLDISTANNRTSDNNAAKTDDSSSTPAPGNEDTNPNTEEAPSTMPTKRRKLFDPVDKALVEYLNKSSKQTEVEIDGNHHFCMNLAHQLRKMPEATAAYAKFRIQQLMYEIEFPELQVIDASH